MIAALLALSFGGYYMLITKPVQNLIGKRILLALAERTNTTITASSVSFSRFKNLEIYDLYVADQQDDTLVFVPYAKAELSAFDRVLRQVTIKSLAFRKPQVNVVQGMDSAFNFQFLIDSLSAPQKSDSLRWQISFADVKIKEAELALTLAHKEKMPFHALSVQSHFSDHSVQLYDLKFMMTNGFEVKKAQGVLQYDSSGYVIPELVATTSHSSLRFKDMALKSPNGPLRGVSRDSLLLQLQSIQSVISGKDISCFLPDSLAFTNEIVIDGLLTGNLSAMKSADFALRIDSLIKVKCDFEVDHLLLADEARFSIGLDEFSVDVIEALTFYNKMRPQHQVELSTYQHWDEISYNGSVYGTYDQLFTKGKLVTPFGQLFTNVEVQLPDSVTKLSYKGDVSTVKYHLGKALGTTATVGDLSANLYVEGKGFPGSGIANFFKGNISALTYKDYTYQGIYLEGGVDRAYFNGLLSVNDPNASFDFNGEINFDKIDDPIFNFSLLLHDIDLARVNLAPNYNQMHLSLGVKSQLIGANIDDLNGYLDVSDFYIETEYGEFSTDTLSLAFKPLDAQPSITVSSDYINGQMLGSYNFAELPGFVNEALKHHMHLLPSVFDLPTQQVPNDFSFNIEIANMRALALAIDYPLRANGFMTLQGKIDSRMDVFEVESYIPYLLTREQLLDSVTFSMTNNFSQLISTLDIGKLTFAGNHVLNDINFSADLTTDTVQFKAQWLNEREDVNSGDFSAALWLQPYGRQMMTVIGVNPSDFVLSDALWQMHASTISILPQRTIVDHFSMTNDSSYLEANGVFSSDIEDSLRFDLQNFDLTALDQFLSIKNFTFDGVLSGKANLYQVLGDPVVDSDIEVKDATVNYSYWGNVKANTLWDNVENVLHVDLKCSSPDGRDSLVSIVGQYAPDSDALALTCTVSDFPIDFLQI